MEAVFPAGSYERRRPSPPLSDYVRELYFYRGAALSLVATMMHGPALHVLFNLGAPIRVYPPGGPGVTAGAATGLILGPHTTYQTVECPPHLQVYGVYFKPAAAYPFLGFPLSELRDQSVPAEVAWGREATRIGEQLEAAPSVEAAFDVLERFLLSRLADIPYGLPTVRRGIEEIARHQGDLPIAALASKIGLSHNQMGRQFKRIAGVTPKEMARFYRMAGALRAMVQGEPDRSLSLTALAHHSGFYDQSHFIREFRALTGHRPAELMQCPSSLRIEAPPPSIL